MNTGKKPAAPKKLDKIIDFLSNRNEAAGIRTIMIGIGSKDRQNIKQAVIELEKSGKIERNVILKGPICIDNIHSNSSLGDQFASRALALLNDKLTVKLIYTIDRYIPDGCTEEDDECRIYKTTNIPLAELDAKTLNWSELL